MGSEMIVTAGVDTHTDVHVAAVLDQAGRLLGTKAFPATTRGYAQLAPGRNRSAWWTRWAWKAPAASAPGCCGSSPTMA
jgi:hypothetical protein